MATGAPVGMGLAAAAEVVVPNFWDPRARPEKPELSGLRVIRFLTEDDYPPLHFADPEGQPAGFSVDLARAACEALQITCTIQVRRFDTLLDALDEARGDVVAAAIPITASLRRRFAVTTPYHRTPARFAARKEPAPPEPSAPALAGRSVAVVGGSAHAAYLEAFFPQADRRNYLDFAAARAALRRGEVDYLFADGLTLALWLNGSDAAGCCTFRGGPYLESRFFGEGVGFILRPDDEPLRRALDYALHKLWDDGTFAELYLRYFPVSFY
ncbi:transporter substrate-binding domain-containing protein [Chelatococcus sp. SYSU_G07232]|uniref:Transporter substrate-binding domain-containing protein n=2 Tax=Chelatococcus albus TaxID=3047466 RepID=A0ABT7AF52_9HYPH|nr:transporter substrate-binding domain-containing protein [Chelatococcus sp. SYSU_G07232]MDJ1158001.1 transporter substrate-binding domain-containing protein [Chelatococcus sp. SYSU_G07232]